MADRARVPLLLLAVGLVLADSAIVTLALPDVLAAFGAEVDEVAWVLTAFNLVLALAAVPAALAGGAHRGGGRAGRVTATGLVVFAAASAACAVAPSLGVLVAARCLQAVGGAAVLAGALEVLVAATGDPRRGAALWAAAGVAGAAVGPVAGGLLTQFIAWEAIFVVQVPLALAALAACRPAARPAAAEGPPTVEDVAPGALRRRPAVAANLGLALVSAALTAALFLLVLLLVEGWGRSPAVAALTVTVVPLAALGAAAAARALGGGPAREAAAGALLLAGGLAGLALLPGAAPGWTIAPQVLVGLGLGLTIAALTDAALRDRGPLALQGAWTIAARHAGVCLGLLLLTPVFTADLATQRAAAEGAGTALLLDARLDPALKLALADDLVARLDDDVARLPDLRPVFAAQRLAPADRPALARLEADLGEEVRRAATRAFRTSFLVAAGLAALGLVPVALLGRRR